MIQSTTITVESRIYNLDDSILIEYGKISNHIFRKLFNELRYNPDSEFKVLQKEYSKLYNIPVRLFKSLYIKTKGSLSSLKELNKLYIREKEIKLDSLEKKLKKTKKESKRYYLSNQINNLHQEIDNLKQQEIFNINFGTKKLFKKQFNQNINHDSWLKEWRRKRDHHLYFVGSKDESYGNSLCQLINLNQLRITLPESLIKDSKYLILDINLDHKGKNYDLLKTAIQNHQALTYNISQKENGKWYINVSFQITSELDENNYDGCMGIDLNYNLISTSMVEKNGNTCNNKESFVDYHLKMNEWSKERIENEISLILDDMIKRCRKENKFITIEDLDFINKKSIDNGSVMNKKLHLLPYSKFYSMLLNKCVKNGILLKKVDPSYTSVISRYKYKNQFGRSIHSLASYVIGRRGLNFRESIPHGIRSLLQSEEKMIDKHESWKNILRLLQNRYPILKKVGFSLRKSKFKSKIIQNAINQAQTFGAVPSYLGV